MLAFNRALADMAKALNSDVTDSEKLHYLVKLAARALGVRGCSLMLLDAQKKRLFHTASHGLSDRYLRKGFIEAEKNLTEVKEGQIVTIIDTATDPLIQFREITRQEQITSILSIPVKIKQEVVGIIRAYSRIQREFTSIEEQFLTSVSNLVGVVLECGRFNQGKQTIEAESKPAAMPAPLTSHIRSATFAHPSEEEFAKLLDFYQIDWLYEPRSFVLPLEAGPIETLTPDFYLPALDLYIEITTLKPGLTREKNRKVRRLRELFPEINIKLLARRDYDQLLSKYGHGPLAGTKTRGVGRVLISANRVQKRVNELARDISHDYEGCHPVLIGVLKGVFCFMADLSRYLTVPVDVDFMAISYYAGEKEKAVHVTKDVDIDLGGRHVLLVEDIVDTGMTLSFVLNHLKGYRPASLKVCSLLDKRKHRLADVSLNYVGFEAPDEFLVGYGLDYREEYRNLPFIALLVEEKPVE